MFSSNLSKKRKNTKQNLLMAIMNMLGMNALHEDYGGFRLDEYTSESSDDSSVSDYELYYDYCSYIPPLGKYGNKNKIAHLMKSYNNDPVTLFKKQQTSFGKEKSLMVEINEKSLDDRPQMNLLDVPDEVLLHIFSYLCPNELLKVSLTCKSLKTLSKSKYVWIPRLYQCWSGLSFTSKIKNNHWNVEFMNEKSSINYPELHALYEAYPTQMELTSLVSGECFESYLMDGVRVYQFYSNTWQVSMIEIMSTFLLTEIILQG